MEMETKKEALLNLILKEVDTFEFNKFECLNLREKFKIKNKWFLGKRTRSWIPESISSDGQKLKLISVSRAEEYFKDKNGGMFSPSRAEANFFCAYEFEEVFCLQQKDNLSNLVFTREEAIECIAAMLVDSKYLNFRTTIVFYEHNSKYFFFAKSGHAINHDSANTNFIRFDCDSTFVLSKSK